MRVVTTTPLQFPELRINFLRAPFDNPEFRRALSTAVGRKELNDTVWLGKAGSPTAVTPTPTRHGPTPTCAPPTSRRPHGRCWIRWASPTPTATVCGKGRAGR